MSNIISMLNINWLLTDQTQLSYVAIQLCCG